MLRQVVRDCHGSHIVCGDSWGDGPARHLWTVFRYLVADRSGVSLRNVSINPAREGRRLNRSWSLA